MQFKLTIRLGNAAMLTSGDLAESLRTVANSLDNRDTGGDVTRIVTQSIFDLNGNRVGSWSV